MRPLAHGGPSPLLALSASGGGGGLPVLDNFQRADESPLSDGGKWGGAISGANELELVSRQGRQATTNYSGQSWGTTFGPDCGVGATFAVAPTNYIRMYLRCDTANCGNNGYYAYWFGANVYLYRIDAGAGHNQASASWTPADGDLLEITVVGSLFTITQNGVTLLTHTDATYSAAGYIGIAGHDTTYRLANFRGGTL